MTKLQGGHSNQLFQYAIARCLAVRRQTDAYMDSQWFDSIAEVDTRRTYELDAYRFEQHLIAPGDVAVEDADKPTSTRRGLLSRGRARRPTLRRYRQQGHAFDPQVLDLPDNTYLEGWWQDERYFSEIRPILLDELELRDPPSARDQVWLRQIDDSMSVSLHVRRGDYVTNPDTTTFHGVLGVSYYRAALERLVDVTGERDLSVFVFSNDIDWCKRELDLGYPTVFVDAGNSGADDMRLMKRCRHHVVANSSFSWWGAWLSDHQGKVVIAPANWFADPQANAETEVVPQSWLRV